MIDPIRQETLRQATVRAFQDHGRAPGDRDARVLYHTALYQWAEYVGNEPQRQFAQTRLRKDGERPPPTLPQAEPPPTLPGIPPSRPADVERANESWIYGVYGPPAEEAPAPAPRILGTPPPAQMCAWCTRPIEDGEQAQEDWADLWYHYPECWGQISRDQAEAAVAGSYVRAATS